MELPGSCGQFTEIAALSREGRERCPNRNESVGARGSGFGRRALRGSIRRHGASHEAGGEASRITQHQLKSPRYGADISVKLRTSGLRSRCGCVDIARYWRSCVRDP